jgi:WD40 repeat protein
MKATVGRMAGAAWPCVACLGLLLSPLSAQEPRPRGTLRGHAKEVPSLAFSPDGKALASAGGDFVRPIEVKLWDVRAAKEQTTLKGHTGLVLSVAFSPDGKVLATAGDDGTVRLWEVPPAKQAGK